MHIIGDSAADLPEGRWAELGVTMVPHTITLGEETLRNQLDVTSIEFYQKLAETGLMPTTSQPSPGEFVELFKKAAADSSDNDLLVITVSAGLSGTFNAAKAAVEMTDGINVTLHDSGALSAEYGWQIEAAALANQAGWERDTIIEMVSEIGSKSHSIFTLDDTKYLVHGGRISHLQGLLANILSIRPLVFVSHETGKYDQIGRARTTKKAYQGLVDYMTAIYPPDTHLHIQLVEADNKPGLAMLKELIEATYSTITWRDSIAMSPVLGAHTGPTMAGLAFCPQEVFDKLPFYTPENAGWKK